MWYKYVAIKLKLNSDNLLQSLIWQFELILEIRIKLKNVNLAQKLKKWNETFSIADTIVAKFCKTSALNVSTSSGPVQ